MALIKHILIPTWAYFSTSWKVSPNTFVTNSERLLYVGGPGVKAAFKIPGVPIGTRVTVDMEEYNEVLGYHRVFKFTDIVAMVPAAVTAFLKEKYPNQEEWQIWIDRSGLSDWTDPVVEPEPEPEPEPDPLPVPVKRKFRIVAEFELEEILE